MTVNPVFTIGHSTHSLDTFVSLLQSHGVSAVSDVRSAPYSRIAPQFGREAIERSLKQHGIKYVFLGAELGARSSDPSCYEHGRVQYKRLAESPLFQSGIERVATGAKTYRIALMCSEREPLACHRTILVAKVLTERGLTVNHILGDGRVESHDGAMERLLRIVGFANEDLFKPKVELVTEALLRQEERVAYTDDKFDTARVAETS